MLSTTTHTATTCQLHSLEEENETHHFFCLYIDKEKLKLLSILMMIGNSTKISILI